MPQMDEALSTNDPIRLLSVGYSGSGKTSALAALAFAGYRLRIMDYDKGVPIIRTLLTHPASPLVKLDPARAKAALSRIHYLEFHSKINIIAGKLVPVRAQAWTDSMEALKNWQDRSPPVKSADGKPVMEGGREKREPIGPNFGPITSWTRDDVLIADSFTALQEAALDFIQGLNGRLGQNPTQPEWGEAQRLVQSFLQIVTDPEVNCNVILNCHIKDISKDGEPSRLMPWGLGQALPPEIPRKFNNMLEVRRKSGDQRVILTRPAMGLVGLDIKTTVPFGLAPELPIDTGLATFFEALRGGVPAPTKGA